MNDEKREIEAATTCPTCEGRKTVTKTLTFEGGVWRNVVVPFPDCVERKDIAGAGFLATMAVLDGLTIKVGEE